MYRAAHDAVVRVVSLAAVPIVFVAAALLDVVDKGKGSRGGRRGLSWLLLHLLPAAYRGAARSLRRLGVLMLLGCLHGLLFEGDILMLYAELGVLLLLLHRLPTKWLLSLGLLLTLSFPLGHLLGGDREDEWPADNAAEASTWLEEDRIESPLAVGSFMEVLAYHAAFLPERFWADWQYPDSGFLVLASFLLGFCLMRSGWGALERLTVAQSTGIALALWGLGLSLMTIEAYWSATVGYAPFHC